MPVESLTEAAELMAKYAVHSAPQNSSVNLNDLIEPFAHLHKKLIGKARSRCCLALHKRQSNDLGWWPST